MIFAIGTAIETGVTSMNIKLFTTKYSQLMNKALDVYARQHKAIAENVSNASDPNFQRVNTDFSKSLQQAENARLKKSDPRHLGALNDSQSSSLRPEELREGPIDLTREMVELAEMQIKHDLVTRTLSRYYRGISSAITGRNS